MGTLGTGRRPGNTTPEDRSGQGCGSALTAARQHPATGHDQFFTGTEAGTDETEGTG